MRKLLEFPDLNQEHFSQSSHIGVCDSDLTPPRAAVAKKICAGAAAFFRDPGQNATIDLLVLLKNYDFVIFSSNISSDFYTVY